MAFQTKEHLCKFCGETNPEEFYKTKKSCCKVCDNKRNKEWRQSNTEHIKKYGLINKERTRKYQQDNKEHINERSRRYRYENKEALREYSKQYYQANKETIGKQAKQFYQDNRETVLDSRKKYSKNNRKDISNYQSKYNKERNQTDPGFRYLCNLRTRQGQVFRGVVSTTQGLGCTSQELRNHLESLFQEGMTLDNHGEWHIDHILPLSSHDKDSEGNWCTESEYNRKLIHYTNLQPLWAEDNIKKSNKIWHDLENDL